MLSERTPNSCSVDIRVSCFEWRPADIVSWAPSKGHLLIPTRLRMVATASCPIFANPTGLLGRLRLPNKPVGLAKMGQLAVAAIRRRVGIKRCLAHSTHSTSLTWSKPIRRAPKVRREESVHHRTRRGQRRRLPLGKKWALPGCVCP